MTKPEEAGASTAPTTRRSTRAATRTQGTTSKDDVPKKPTSKPLKGSKSSADVTSPSVSEGEDEERPAARASRRTPSKHSKKPQSSGTTNTKGNGKKASTPIAIPSPSVSEDENEAEELEEESSSSEEDNSDSDFEEESQTRKSKSGTLNKPRQSRAIERISIIKPRKSKSERKEPGTSKTPKTKGAKSITRTKRISLEDVDEGEGQSALYDAVLDPQTALDVVIADWISSYEDSSDEAMLNLTNFLIRCCGCKQFISADDFKDQDEMVDTLENILIRYKETTVNFDYPVVSKAKEFKKFKKNLLEFYTRLIQKVQGDILFDGVFMDTLLNWTISLSSSTFRPVRHTAATVALNLGSSLAEISNELQEDLNVTNRQLATSQKQKALPSKIKVLEKKAKESRTRKSSISKWSETIFSSVYVLRCRDVDPLVRVDCIHELGQWMIANPDHFVATSYLRYLSWGLSDKVAAVRLEALKVLAKLYEIENQPNGLRLFTNRCVERLLGMAIGESDTQARQGAIRVATLIHKHGQLDEEAQVQLSTLIFGANGKVRKSLAKFIKARVWEDEVDSRMAECELLAQDEGSEVKKDWVELKSLVNFLIKVGKEAEKADTAKDGAQASVTGTRLFDETKVGRVSLAIEALWSEIEVLKNWKSIAEYLLVDQNSTPESSSSRKPRSLEDAYHLDDEEENVLLEIFVTSVQLTLQPPVVPGFQKDKAKQKAQQADTESEVGGYCANIIPQLFLKYGVDASRIRPVLVISQVIPLNVYIDLRIVPAYEELVDDVIKIFKRHSDPSVLSAAALTLRTMQSYEMLRSSHETRIEALGMSVVDSFLTLVSQNPRFEVVDKDVLNDFTICLRRLEHLVKCTDVTTKRIRSTDQDPFKCLLKVIKGYSGLHDQDAEILISALSISFLWISWVCRGKATKYSQDADWREEDVQELLDMRESLVKVISDLTTNGSLDVDARVRRRAFQILGDIYWLFGGDLFHASKGPNRHRLHMTCPETTQTECEQFLRSELDLWEEKIQEKMNALRQARTPKARSNGDNAELQDDEDEAETDEASNIAEQLEDERLAAEQIEQEDKYEMFGTVFSFMRQIMLKDFSMVHATAVIARYGRFGAEYDEGVKRVVTSIRAQTSEGASKMARDQKIEVFMKVCFDSLKESFERYLDGRLLSLSQTLQLAKVLSTAIKPPGFMQSIRAGIDQQRVWKLHRQGVTYAVQKIAGGTTSEDRKAKAIQFFDVLSQLPLVLQSSSDDITSTQELITSECEGRTLEVDESETWTPLRSYQSKLDKLVQRAAAEQANAAKKAEAAAELQDENQGQEQQTENQNDVEMDVAEDEQLEKAPEKISGKKRQADDIDDEDDGEGEEAVADSDNGGSSDAENAIPEQGRRNREGSVGGNAEDDPTLKETKRIRMH
ncbi:hypothetical protein B0O80DRAFT_157373 [Mortierella sp. GBAus27b]|nr:hypothetical protein BGX31_011641 [Mortierella sp. GBA43]KAI8361372.1 hypothetical protein B0O80DRAFT_157373 [Mortierella sp. GBAus27b]